MLIRLDTERLLEVHTLSCCFFPIRAIIVSSLPFVVNQRRYTGSFGAISHPHFHRI